MTKESLPSNPEPPLTTKEKFFKGVKNIATAVAYVGYAAHTVGELSKSLNIPLPFTGTAATAFDFITTLMETDSMKDAVKAFMKKKDKLSQQDYEKIGKIFEENVDLSDLVTKNDFEKLENNVTTLSEAVINGFEQIRNEPDLTAADLDKIKMFHEPLLRDIAESNSEQLELLAELRSFISTTADIIVAETREDYQKIMNQNDAIHKDIKVLIEKVDRIEASTKGRQVIPEPPEFEQHDALILFAPFRRSGSKEYNPAFEWPALLRNTANKLTAGRDIEFNTLPKGIRTQQQAQEMRTKHDATAVVWGEITQQHIEVNYTASFPIPFSLPGKTYIRSSETSSAKEIVKPETFAMLVEQGAHTEYVLSTLVGLTSLLGGNLNDALKLFSHALDIAPKDPTQALNLKVDGLYALRASLLLLTNTPLADKKVLDDVTKALKLNPSNIMALHVRGSYWLNHGYYLDAINDFKQVISLAPNAPEAYQGLACIYEQTGEYDKAIDYYTLAIKFAPKMTALHFARGEIFRETKQYPEAITDYQTAISLEPKFPDSYFLLAEMYSKLYKFPEEFALLSDALEQDFDDKTKSDLYFFRGQVLEILKRYKEAQKDFDECLKHRNL